MDADRLSPEQSVLGALLIQPELTGRAAVALRDEDFQAAPARLVWQTLRRLWASGSAIDPVIVKDQLEGFDHAAQYIVDLMAAVPTAANLDYYINATKRAAAMAAVHPPGPPPTTITSQLLSSLILDCLNFTLSLSLALPRSPESPPESSPASKSGATAAATAIVPTLLMKFLRVVIYS